MNFGEKIAREGLKIKAVKIDTECGILWASGIKSPIYNDNRMFLPHPRLRMLITNGFASILFREEVGCDIIAGTSTAGIPFATSLADKLKKPLIYIREKPKDHGLRKRIEGMDSKPDLENKRVILIEDLISTGRGSASAIEAIRDANGECNYCFSIFNYELDVSKKIFAGEIPYDEENKNVLNPPCEVRSLLTYDKLLEVAIETGYINNEQAEFLERWREDVLERKTH